MNDEEIKALEKVAYAIMDNKLSALQRVGILQYLANSYCGAIGEVARKQNTEISKSN